MPGNATTKPEKTEEGNTFEITSKLARKIPSATSLNTSKKKGGRAYIVVEEVAFRAEVFAETCSAVRTVLLHILFFVAERADNQLDVVTGKHVAVVDADLQRVLGFVVAVPATKYLAAARRPYLASPPVVHAPVLLWSGVTVHRSRLSSLLLLCSFLIPD